MKAIAKRPPLTLLCALLLVYNLAFAATYYVDVTGHSTNTGTRLASPYQTINLHPPQPNQGTRP